MSLEKKLKFIAEGGGNGLGIEWWRRITKEALQEIERLREIESHDEALNNCLKEIERLWVGINQAMFLLAKEDLMDTEGFRMLRAVLKDCKIEDHVWQTKHPLSL